MDFQPFRMQSEWLMKNRSPVILAVDTSDKKRAIELIEATRDSISIFKLGLEFFSAHGRAGVEELRHRFGDFDLFLDLKLHDIPNTVAAACKSIRDLNPRFLTVHASGGGEMIRAAVQELPESSITAVTVLTSLNESSLRGMGINGSILELSISMAQQAVSSGARSIVSSPLEVAAIRENVPSNIELITPGVRPQGAQANDQQRVMTPGDALKSGANFVVIGRPITAAENPSSAAQEIIESLSR